MNWVPVDRHGPILGEDEAAASGRPSTPLRGPKTALKRAKISTNINTYKKYVKAYINKNNINYRYTALGGCYVNVCVGVCTLPNPGSYVKTTNRWIISKNMQRVHEQVQRYGNMCKHVRINKIYVSMWDRGTW